MKTKEILLDRFFEEVEGRIRFREGYGLQDLANYIDKEKEQIEDNAREGERRTIEYILRTLFGKEYRIIRWFTPSNDNDFGIVTYSEDYDPKAAFNASKETGTWSFLNYLKEEFFKKSKL